MLFQKVINAAIVVELVEAKCEGKVLMEVILLEIMPTSLQLIMNF